MSFGHYPDTNEEVLNSLAKALAKTDIKLTPASELCPKSSVKFIVVTALLVALFQAVATNINRTL